MGDPLVLVAVGVVQGLLEWLPVSSSGQVVALLTLLLGVPAGRALLEAFASHAGTAVSGAAIAWRELLDALRLGPWFRVVAVPTLAAAPVGFAILRSTLTLPGDLVNLILGASLLATAAALRGAERAGPRQPRSPGDLSNLELALVGLAEGLAALPGLSRSGLTLAALALLGVEPEEAVRASLALGVPVTLAAGLYAGSSLPLGDAALLGVASMAAGLASAGAMLALARRLRGRMPEFLAALGLLILALEVPALLAGRGATG
ncbi:MAG: undecaprenyl-diphosphate phosphatase [Desulfurococcales archaeon]|nr:undecaprenyl-diphosphate phosphatase [Desulfurococcales archaeon]